MSEHFNELTPAETERLALLLEELGEAQQAIGKILRHGYESYNPTVPISDRATNRVMLSKELGDVSYAISLMCEAGDLRQSVIREFQAQKAITCHQYLHHQDNPGNGGRE